jgi:hypothetical protein
VSRLGRWSSRRCCRCRRRAGHFRAAITQSGAGAHAISAATATKVTGLLAEQLGVEPTRAAIPDPAAEHVYKAAEALTNEMQTVADPVKWGELALSLLPFMPTVDARSCHRRRCRVWLAATAPKSLCSPGRMR